MLLVLFPECAKAPSTIVADINHSRLSPPDRPGLADA
jgi:hypothetical protein